MTKIRISWLKEGRVVHTEERESGGALTVVLPTAPLDEVRITTSLRRCQHENTITHNLKGFKPRRGCLDCNIWLDSVELDGTPTT